MGATSKKKIELTRSITRLVKAYWEANPIEHTAIMYGLLLRALCKMTIKDMKAWQVDLESL